jgi:hypothetical protein
VGEDGGGGGGSYVANGVTNAVEQSAVQSGNGEVSITELPGGISAAPEVDSWAFGAGLLAIAALDFMRRKFANRKPGGLRA